MEIGRSDPGAASIKVPAGDSNRPSLSGGATQCRRKCLNSGKSEEALTATTHNLPAAPRPRLPTLGRRTTSLPAAGPSWEGRDPTGWGRTGLGDLRQDQPGYWRCQACACRGSDVTDGDDSVTRVQCVALDGRPAARIRRAHRARSRADGSPEPIGRRAPLGLPCQMHEPDLWFADAPADLELAKGLCGGCPAQQMCLAGAIDRREPYGVWGGEIFQHGQIVTGKRSRGRPRKDSIHVPPGKVNP
jgi:WhiB family transcriptional regulator, redox-sensing transcriptional regulator